MILDGSDFVSYVKRCGAREINNFNASSLCIRALLSIWKSVASECPTTGGPVKRGQSLAHGHSITEGAQALERDALRDRSGARLSRPDFFNQIK